MNLQAEHTELDGQVKEEEADVSVKSEEEEIPVLFSQPFSQLHSAPPATASSASSSQTHGPSPNLSTQQAATCLAKKAVDNNASAIPPSTAPAAFMSRHGSAHASIPGPSSAPKLNATTNGTSPSLGGSGARQPATTKPRSTTAPNPVLNPQPTSTMGSASYINPFSFQLPLSASQPSQRVQSRQKPMDPTDTAKLAIHPNHEATASPGNETRMCLDNKAHGAWTCMTSSGDMRALPNLASCGSWGVSLPSKMNAAVHIGPYIDRLNGLLHVEIESTESPPSISVKFSKSQLAGQAEHPYLLEEHTAMRWKAWAVLASWVDHLVLRGAPPAIPPIDVVSFVRNRLLAEGRHAKTNAITLLQERQGATLLPEGHHTSQMPRLTPASILPKPENSRAETSRAQLHGLLPAANTPLVSAAGKKRPLYGGSSSSSSSSSSSDSSPEIQAKRLRRAA